jgi:hypothetical protein
MWIDINYLSSAQQLIHKINSNSILKENWLPPRGPTRRPTRAQRARTHVLHARGSPRRSGPRVESGLGREPARAHPFMQKHPRANDKSTRSPTYYSRRVRHCKKDPVIYLVYHGQVPSHPCVHWHGGRWHWRTRRPPGSPKTLTKGPTLT